MRCKLLAPLVACSLLVAAEAFSAPCAGFTDVDSTDPFCTEVAWVKNRGITLGCTTTTLFCPNDPVTRLQMATFMYRQGNVTVQLGGNAIGGTADSARATIIRSRSSRTTCVVCASSRG